jgi:hypothetical protein
MLSSPAVATDGLPLGPRRREVLDATPIDYRRVSCMQFAVRSCMSERLISRECMRVDDGLGDGENSIPSAFTGKLRASGMKRAS